MDISEFYILAQGTMQFVPSGSAVDIPVRESYYANILSKKTVRRWRRRKRAENTEKKEDDLTEPPLAAPKKSSAQLAFDFANILPFGSIFGELSILTQKKWRSGSVFALEDSSVIVFTVAQVTKIIRVSDKYSRALVG